MEKRFVLFHNSVACPAVTMNEDDPIYYDLQEEGKTVTNERNLKYVHIYREVENDYGLTEYRYLSTENANEYESQQSIITSLEEVDGRITTEYGWYLVNGDGTVTVKCFIATGVWQDMLSVTNDLIDKGVLPVYDSVENLTALSCALFKGSDHTMNADITTYSVENCMMIEFEIFK
ncbi:hypothetical protein BH753_gp047 [Bacillus phage Shbh1]|uniref:Uncharacterized protein n=1 Tax=Bacillus phage Shbh1 TaxID=1796992 RepID=A0A142F172_9CAUD|nr:hypothetical protein BH753_gp047 [Bacillus phage Shbh1]AMQ66529.1 hypothetical protein [Bacillus phage Shbh1]